MPALNWMPFVRRRTAALSVLAVAAVFCASQASAQTAAAGAPPRFEVASVKPVPASDRRMSLRGGPGTREPERLTWPTVSLIDVLTRAYGVSSEQISGPGWISTATYSISAKIPPHTNEADFRLMLQRLLEDRFHLEFHRSSKESTPYELVVAGQRPRMKQYVPATQDVGAALADSDAPHGPVEKDKEGFPVLPPGMPGVAVIGDGMYRGTYRLSMPDFIRELPMMVSLSTGAAMNARILDRTNLSGRYEFKLEFAMAPPASAGSAVDPGAGPSIFAALEKQLGLRLVKGKKTGLDVLVIDSIDKVPTEN